MKGDKVKIALVVGDKAIEYVVEASLSGQAIDIIPPPDQGRSAGPGFWTLRILGRTGKMSNESRFASSAVLAIIDERKPDLKA